MRTAAIVAFSAGLATCAASEGFVKFDIGKRAPITPKRSTPRQRDADATAQLEAGGAHWVHYVNVSLGNPPQQAQVLLDSGSSYLWLPSASMCETAACDRGSYDANQSSTYQLLMPGGFQVDYVDGTEDLGDWVSDNVSIDGVTIEDQVFGLAYNGSGAEGIMGIGFGSYDQQLDNDGNGTYHTIIDSMTEQGLINRQAYSVFLNSRNAPSGSIIFGGVDSSKYTGDLIGLPLQVDDFLVALTQVAFTDANGNTIVLTPDDYAQNVDLDTGTSFTTLTDDVLIQVLNGLGASNPSDGTYTAPCKYIASNATLDFTFGGQDGPTISISMAELMTVPYDSDNCIIELMRPIGGGDYATMLFGDSFLRSAYAVFDIAGKSIALAQAAQGYGDDYTSIDAIPTGTVIPGVTIVATATGTSLPVASMSSTLDIPQANSAQPTFALGVDDTSDSTRR